MRFRRAAVLAVAISGIAIGASPATAATTAHYRHERGWDLNDLRATPGSVLKVSASTVCKVGYSSTVRNVSATTKNEVYAEYGIKTHRAYQYEVDHLISLELGGSNAITNLWPEPNDKAQQYEGRAGEPPPRPGVQPEALACHRAARDRHRLDQGLRQVLQAPSLRPQLLTFLDYASDILNERFMLVSCPMSASSA